MGDIGIREHLLQIWELKAGIVNFETKLFKRKMHVFNSYFMLNHHFP